MTERFRRRALESSKRSAFQHRELATHRNREDADEVDGEVDNACGCDDDDDDDADDQDDDAE